MAEITVIHEKYMKEALKQAKKAYSLGEVPIGCVIVHEGKIIGRGYNRRNTDKNTLAHAEITAINRASKVIGDWRLEECTLYVTLEPCQMCAGAIVQARIPEVVMGCMNPKAGCGGSVLNLLEMPGFNHQANVTRGVLGQECSDMLKLFFTQLRARSKAEKEAKKNNTETNFRKENGLMNKNAFRQLSYGVYVVSTWDEGRATGCTANSAMQITSDPATIAISINHDNYTNQCIQSTGKFAVSILGENSNPSVIGTFGFKSGRDNNKFDEVESVVRGFLPVVADACAYIVCEVIDKMETSTHTVFLGKVLDADMLKQDTPMTYAYYHNVIKGRSPKNAPTYIAE